MISSKVLVGIVVGTVAMIAMVAMVALIVASLVLHRKKASKNYEKLPLIIAE